MKYTLAPEEGCGPCQAGPKARKFSGYDLGVQSAVHSAVGGAYTHDRCAYFGMYRNKVVEKVAYIRAVVDVESESAAVLKWKNIEADNTQLKKEALTVALARRGDEPPLRIFLLGDLHDTAFCKDSPGGMMGSKQYFDISRLDVENANELAESLNGKTWSDLRA